MVRKPKPPEAQGPGRQARQGLRRGLQQLRHHRPGRPIARPGDRRRLAGRRLRQLVRHHPGLHRLLPARAQGRRPSCSARPRHPPGPAGHRPDAARPAHGRSSPPTTCPDLRPCRARGGPHVVGLGPWSSPRPRASSGTPRWSGRRTPRSSGSTSTARSRRSSTTPRPRTSTPRRREVLVELARTSRAVAVITGRPARQALELGGLDEVGNAIGEAGSELLPLRPVRQRALVLDQPPDRLAPAPARPLDVPARAARVLRRDGRRRRVRRGEGAGGRRPHPAAGRPRRGASSGCCRC